MTSEVTEPAVQPAPTPEGYVIRIVEPVAVASAVETQVYPTLDATEEPLLRVQEKLYRFGVKEYVINVVNLATDGVELVFTRRPLEVPRVD